MMISLRARAVRLPWTLLAFAVAGSLAIAGCHRDAPDEDAADAAPSAVAAPAPVEPKAIAEATSRNAPLKVQVLSAQHVTADTVKVEIALINLSKPPAPDAAPASTDGTAATPAPDRLDLGTALRGDAADRARPFTAADVCLLTHDSSRRLFVLRDPSDKPVMGGSFDPLAAGERRVVWVMLPSPGSSSGSGSGSSSGSTSAAGAEPHVTLQIGNLILRDVPVAPLPPANPS